MKVRNGEGAVAKTHASSLTVDGPTTTFLDIDFDSPGWWQSAEDSWRTWRQPKSGDLVHDAADLHKKAKATTKQSEQARYARASLVLSVAAIEAISNDTLVSLYALIADHCPSECVGLEPWVCFRGVSLRRIERLIRRGSLPKKLQYVFRHLARLGFLEDDELEQRIKQTIQARNRLVHMSYLLSPKKYASVLTPDQIKHLAGVGVEAARQFIQTVGEAFAEIHLPIATIRTYPLSDDDE